MNQVLTISLLLLAAAGSALADSPDCPFPLRAALPEFQGKPVEVDRGASLTKSARHEGLKVQFQEGRRETNWTQLSTDGSELLNGPVKLSAAPLVMVNREGRTGYGASFNVRVKAVLELDHTSKLGGIEQHITTAKLAPRSPMSWKVVRSISGDAPAVTRVGPELKLGSKTNVSYGHAIDGAPHQLLITSNLRF